MKFGRYYKLTNGKIFAKRIFPNTRLASPARWVEGNIWRGIYRWLFGKN